MRAGFRFSMAVPVVLAVMIVGGCASPVRSTAITYSFEPGFSFPEAKTLSWTKAQRYDRQDPLLEANVRFLADRALQAKGFLPKADRPDLLIWMSYDLDAGSYTYELRILTLNIARADNNELVWRGRATGSIRTDAASDELKTAVEGMLANFPPK